jgi:hypothetical protein
MSSAPHNRGSQLGRRGSRLLFRPNRPNATRHRNKILRETVSFDKPFAKNERAQLWGPTSQQSRGEKKPPSRRFALKKARNSDPSAIHQTVSLPCWMNKLLTQLMASLPRQGNRKYRGTKGTGPSSNPELPTAG